MFMDDDGTAYQVRTSFTVVQLTDDYLGPAKLSSEIKPPHGSEPPGGALRRSALHPALARTKADWDRLCAQQECVARVCGVCVWRA